MANAFTGTSAVDLSQTAYDRLAYFALRPELYFDNAADVKPTEQSMPGENVVFTIFNDLAEATTPLSETVDVDAVALSDSQVTLSLVEYGNAAITTAKLRGTSFIVVDPVVANVIGYNAGISVDALSRNILAGGTNVDYAGAATSRVTIDSTMHLSAALVRQENARLRSFNVAPINGMYVAYVHPNQAYDFRSETGSASWRDPHTYSQPGEIWSGELGAFEGFRFIETPRSPVFPTGGSGSPGVAVYAALFMGRQALAKAHSIVDGNGPVPHIVPGPVTDKLRRLQPLGWHWLGAYGRFREASLRRVETGSSLTDVDPSIDN